MSLTDKLASERRARLAAERMLELKSRELFEANRKLSYHARALSDQVVEQRRDIDTIRTEAAALKSENTETKANLEQATQEAKLTQQRLLDSMEALTDGIAIFDRVDRLISANHAWFAMFDDLEDIAPGITYTELLKLGVEEGIFDHGDLSGSQWIDQMLDRWDQDEIEDMVVRLWDGRYLNIHDRKAETGDTVTLAIDVTEQIEREAELKLARNRAEAATRAKSAFLANMSHELRTPMNGVVSMAELLAESDLDEDGRLYVDTIQSSGEALLAIINDVLDFSKLEAEKMELRDEEFDLEQLIHKVVLLMQPTAHGKGLQIAVDFDIFLPHRIRGDAGRLRQILTNLVGNAIKFTKEGHVIVRVVGTSDEENNICDIRIVVEDTGIGIPREKLDSIFEQFNQVENDRNRKFDGTGLGLAITKQLVQLMNGEIWVDSLLDEGSSFGFRVKFPYEGALPQLRVGLADNVDRVLIVDEKQVESAILSQRFDQLGVETTCVTTGADALKILADDTAFQVFIVSRRLPDSDGVDVIKSIRDFGAKSPVVMLVDTAAGVDPDWEALDLSVQRRPLRVTDVLELLPDQDASDEETSTLAEAWDEDADLDLQAGKGEEPGEVEESSAPPDDPLAEDSSDTGIGLDHPEDEPKEQPAEAEPAPDDDVPVLCFASRRGKPDAVPEEPANIADDSADVVPVFRSRSRAALSDSQGESAEKTLDPSASTELESDFERGENEADLTVAAPESEVAPETSTIADSAEDLVLDGEEEVAPDTELASLPEPEPEP
ncbi:MAG: ATP-binding protein, partial [Pseudomonadota bacterium]